MILNTEEVIAEIERYVSSPNAPFAVLLEGPWGSGKTRFVDCELAPKLEGQGVTVLRVSMIGVTSAKEVYERILASSVRKAAGIDDASSRKRFGAGRKAAGELGLSYLRQKVKKALGSVDLVYSPAPELLVGVILDENTLVVLDDSERIDDKGSLEFFGAVDGLLERLGKKVLIVHGREGNALAKDIAEKLIMKTCELTPDYECICKSIFAESIEACPSLLVDTIVAAGVKASENLNVRMLIRVKACVARLFESSYANDEGIDESIRHRTLADAVEHVVRAVTGNLQPEPVAPAKDADLGEALCYQRQRAAWDRSKALRHLEDLVKTGTMDGQVLSECLRDYSAVYYPSSELEEKALKIASEIKYCLMDDDEASNAADAILEAFDEGNVCVGNVPRLVAALAALKDWDIITAAQWKSAIAGAEKIVLHDPLEAVRIIHSYEYDWHDIKLRFGRDIPELDSIASYANREASRIMEEEAEEALAACDEHSAEILASRFRAMDERNPGSFVKLEPIYVTSAVVSSSARSISVFRDWVLSLGSDCRLREDKKTDVAKWLREVDSLLDIENIPGKMSKVQVRYLKKNIATAAADLCGDEADV